MRWLCTYVVAALVVLNFTARCTTAQEWQLITTGADSNLRGLSVAHLGGKKTGQPVVWASGSKGTVLLSADAGKSWKKRAVKGGEDLDFRGVVAFDEKTAYVMASGEGEKSRIYKTKDGGASWETQYSDARKEFFLDTIACVSRKECYALGDPIGGKFVLLRTRDGAKWEKFAEDAFPPALPEEGAFAASNSCMAVEADGVIFFVTGGPAGARVFHSANRGKTWTVNEVPLARGSASTGGFSIAASGKHVVVVGGDYREAGRAEGTAAYSGDGGKTWKSSAVPSGGYRSAVAWLGGARFVAAGTNGADLSPNGGANWSRVGEMSSNAVAASDGREIWAVGPKGMVARAGILGR